MVERKFKKKSIMIRDKVRKNSINPLTEDVIYKRKYGYGI